jgi:hypothetical protein
MYDSDSNTAPGEMNSTCTSSNVPAFKKLDSKLWKKSSGIPLTVQSNLKKGIKKDEE